MEMHKQIILDGKVLHYRDEGRDNQQVLVLLHGFLQNLDVWTSFTLSYMRDMRVVSIDLPGHGYSSTFSDTHTMEFMADCVKKVLDSIGVSQCVMAGHSMGGYVALAFAEKYSYMLRGLALLHSHAMADTPEKVAHRDAACSQVLKNRPSYIVNFIPQLFYEGNRLFYAREIKDLQDQCLETKAEGIIAAQKGMALRKSQLPLLEKILVPVLFVIGKNDPRINFELAVSEAMVPRVSEIYILDKVGHMSHIESRVRIKNRLRSFVECCYS